jgi:primosomal protein N' (replication factor Y)
LTLIADVCINVQASRLRRLFSYAVPSSFDFVAPGWRVVVPFGSSTAEGFVLSVRTATAEEELSGLKLISDAPDDEAWFDEEMLATARWLSDYYVCSLGEALRLFIPGKSGIKKTQTYQIATSGEKSEQKSEVYDYICSRGIVTRQRLRTELGVGALPELGRLVKTGQVIACQQTNQRTAIKWSRELRLNVSQSELNVLLTTWRGKPAQRRLLERLATEECLSVSRQSDGVPLDATAKALLQTGLVRMEKTRQQRDSFCNVVGEGKLVQATPAQQAALAEIVPAIAAKAPQTFLLHGVTGSGKTEVYLQAAAAALAEGRQVLVMIPEIAQTSQVLRRFKARFGSAVAVVHSRLSVAERRDVWDLFRSREIDIVIGTRSALFLPGAGLGLIIIDEEHEFTYKQEESPRYHVRETALQRAKQLGATVILGSATPALESYHAAISGDYRLITLPERVDGAALPTVEVVDMREQLKQGRKSVISEPLEKLLQQAVAKGEQAILLLNRRGHSTFVMCRECGHVMRCDHCSVPLVYHMHGGKLSCHYCESFHAVPTSCPQCHGRYIRYFGAGTQRLEEELTNLMPGVRLTRMDHDTTGGKTSHDSLLDGFRQAKTDILLGTQMVAKGHDIENVTAVGILAADSSLNLPDFRSAERTFALVMQAAGRAGRGSKAGRVVVQTYHPGHYSMIAGAAQDYERFYQQEIRFRQELQYPPFAQFLKLTISGGDESRTMKTAEDAAALLQEKLESANSQIDILGPYAAPVAKIGDLYRVQLLLRGENLTSAKQVLIDEGIAGSSAFTIDVDPLGMM